MGCNDHEKTLRGQLGPLDPACTGWHHRRWRDHVCRETASRSSLTYSASVAWLISYDQLYKTDKLDTFISDLDPSIQKAARSKYGVPSPVAGGDAEVDKLNLIDIAGSNLIKDQLFVTPVWKLAIALTTDHPNTMELKTPKVWMYRCRATVDRIARFGTNYGAMWVLVQTFRTQIDDWFHSQAWMWFPTYV